MLKERLRWALEIISRYIPSYMYLCMYVFVQIGPGTEDSNYVARAGGDQSSC